MTSSGHSEEGPISKPLFAITNRKSYQRTVSYIIHLNDVLSRHIIVLSKYFVCSFLNYPKRLRFLLRRKTTRHQQHRPQSRLLA